MDISARCAAHAEAVRQSEELPLHRVLTWRSCCAGIHHFQEAYRHEKLYDEANPIIDGFAGRCMIIEICTANDKIEEDLQLFRDASRMESFGERLRTLARILEEMGY